MKSKYALCLFVGAFLFGCQSTSNKFAGLCQIEESKDTFNNKAKVDFSNCWVAASESIWDIPVHKFGFTWYEDKPESIRLNLTYDSSVSGNAYTNFESIMVNIDGKRVVDKRISNTVLDSSSYNTVTNTIYTSSNAGAVIPFATFERMLKAEDVRIRVNTNDGYSDYIFHIEKNGTMQYAKYDLPRFMSAIDKYR